MKIELDIEIGDPIVLIEFNQHDGYYLNYGSFNWKDVPNYGKTVFKTIADARAELSKLTKKENCSQYSSTR